MSKNPKFFIIIIGTEILNRRRVDAHFNFVSKSLLEKGHKLTGSFIIEDDPALIVQTIKFVASQDNPVLFSFGGIGSTPDDYTRKCAAIALRNGNFVVHNEAKEIIEEKLGSSAYPHPIKMAELPKGAKLLDNPVNKMPAFSLDERYYFMPGFPNMSHPMVDKILEKLIPEKKEYYRHTLTANCKENLFIEIMEKMPKEVEFSSLPKLHTGSKSNKPSWQVSISVASENRLLAQQSFNLYIELLEKENITYILQDEA